MPEIPSGLPSLGQATLVLLRQWGVATAKDVILRGITGHEGLPGLGPAKWAVLWDWALRNADFGERMRLLENRIWTDLHNPWNFESKTGHLLTRDWYSRSDSLSDDECARLAAQFDAIESANAARNAAQKEKFRQEEAAASERQMAIFVGMFIALGLGLAAYLVLK